MKRTLLITGLILVAFPAHAACPESSFAQSLVSQTPIGEYAKAVVRRATDGIDRAKQQPVSNTDGIFDLLAADWVALVSSALLSLVDTKIEVVNRASSLEDMTSCLHIDIAIIQAKMEEARCELNEAVTAKKPGTILRLKSLLIFLQKRVDHLQQGALNPDYEDWGWQTWYPFDQPFMGWCCIQGDDSCREMESIDCLDAPGNFYPKLGDCLNECFDIGDSFDAPDSPEYEKACPFDSDYLAPNTTGYGCHPEKLENYANNIGLDADEDGAVADYEALNELNEKRDEFITDVGHIKDITMALQQFMGEPSDPRLNDFGNTTTDNIDYKKVSGCEADVPANNTLAPPSASWSALPLRTSFSFRKNTLGIWEAFLRLMYLYADNREFADRIKKPSEHWTEAERQQAAKDDNLFLWIIRDQLRPVAQNLSYSQATMDSAVYPKIVDTPQQVIEALTPVRAAMRSAMDLTKKPGQAVGQGKSMRTFVRDLAYYLRRSCLDRPCQEQLDTVLKIIFQDDCFPYAAGNFGASDDALQKCKNAAGL